MLLGHGAGAHHAEMPDNTHGHHEIRALQSPIDERLDRGAVTWFRHLECVIGMKPGDRGERGFLFRIGDRCTAVAPQLVTDSIQHQHLTVETIERAETKVAVVQ